MDGGLCLPERVWWKITAKEFKHDSFLWHVLIEKLLWVTKSPENYKTLLDTNFWPKELQLINNLKRFYQSLDAKTVTQTQIYKKATLEFCINATPQWHSIKTTDDFHSLPIKSGPSSKVSVQC